METKTCPIHNQPMYQKEGKFGVFYSHKVGDTYCNGKVKEGNGVSSAQGQQVPPPAPQTIAPDPYAGLEARLMELPTEIASAAEELNKKIFELDKKKLETKKEEAKAMVALIDTDLSVPEKRAKTDQVTLPFEVDEIVAEKDMRVAKGLYEKLVNTFDATRKVASIKIAEMGRQADSI